MTRPSLRCRIAADFQVVGANAIPCVVSGPVLQFRRKLSNSLSVLTAWSSRPNTWSTRSMFKCIVGALMERKVEAGLDVNNLSPVVTGDVWLRENCDGCCDSDVGLGVCGPMIFWS